MAINNPYVPGDPFSYDLKWIIAKLKEHGVSITALYEAIENIEQRELDANSGRIINVMFPPEGLQALKADGTTDDSSALQAIFDYAVANDYGVYMPAGLTVYIQSTVKATDLRYFFALSDIDADNSAYVILENTPTNGIPKYAYIRNVTSTLKIRNVKNGFYDIHMAENLDIEATVPASGTSYNVFKLGDIGTLQLVGDTSSCWINSNVFLGGRVRTALYIGGGYNHSCNTFYGTLMEGGTLTIDSGYKNVFYDCRAEAMTGFVFGSNAWNNIIYTGYQSVASGLLMPPYTITDATDTNHVVPNDAPLTNAQHLMINRQTLRSPHVQYRKTATGCTATIASVNNPIATLKYFTGKPMYFHLESDTAMWRVLVRVYDSSGNLITTDPGNMVYGLGFTWSSTLYGYYYSANAQSIKFGIAPVRYGLTISPFAYAEVFIWSGIASDFDHLQLTAYSYCDAAYMGEWQHYDKWVHTATPNTGYWDVGDVVQRAVPATGQPFGWVCSVAGLPGTWLALPNL